MALRPGTGAALGDAGIARIHAGDGPDLELVEARGPVDVVPADP